MSLGLARLRLALLSLQAAQRGQGSTRRWRRVDEQWRSTPTEPGGWQGPRAMQPAFAAGLDEACRSLARQSPAVFGAGALAGPDGTAAFVARVGVAGDVALRACASTLAHAWLAHRAGACRGRSPAAQAQVHSLGTGHP